MTKLRELERRLKDEPDNLGLRVMVAGALREAGRVADAVELYRSVAIAYRDQGRAQQAIAVCRSILEIAPADAPCRELLAALAPGEVERELVPVPQVAEERARRSSADFTPLPPALPYHVADPDSASIRRISTSGLVRRPGSEDGTIPEVSGRRMTDLGEVTGEDDIAAELDTRERPRIEPRDLAKISGPPPRDSDDELTRPRGDLPAGMRRPLPLPPSADSAPPPPLRRAWSSGPPPIDAVLGFAFFAPIAMDRRAAVLARFARRMLPAGAVAIHQGESQHPLVVVTAGRLAVRADRMRGATVDSVELGAIGAGEHIGEVSLLARGASPVHVVAAADSDVLLLGARDFYEIVGANPGLWSELRELAARRTREYEARLTRSP